MIFKVFGYQIKTLSCVLLSLNVKAKVSSMHLILNFQRGGDGRGIKPVKPFLSMGIFLNDTDMALDHELMANKWATKFSHRHFI